MRLKSDEQRYHDPMVKKLGQFYGLDGPMQSENARAYKIHPANLRAVWADKLIRRLMNYLRDFRVKSWKIFQILSAAKDGPTRGRLVTPIRRMGSMSDCYSNCESTRFYL